MSHPRRNPWEAVNRERAERRAARERTDDPALNSMFAAMRDKAADQADQDIDQLTPENLLAAGFTEDTIKPIRMFWFRINANCHIRYILNGDHFDWSLCQGDSIEGLPRPLCPRSMRDVRWLIQRCRSLKGGA